MRKRKKNKYGIIDRYGFLLAYDEELKYLRNIIKVTDEELSKLNDYVESDEYACYYNNPWMLYYENGREMNYIDALRTIE